MSVKVKPVNEVNQLAGDVCADDAIKVNLVDEVNKPIPVFEVQLAASLNPADVAQPVFTCSA